MQSKLGITASCIQPSEIEALPRDSSLNFLGLCSSVRAWMFQNLGSLKNAFVAFQSLGSIELPKSVQKMCLKQS
jgi:hypothetical protein